MWCGSDVGVVDAACNLLHSFVSEAVEGTVAKVELDGGVGGEVISL